MTLKTLLLLVVFICYIEGLFTLHHGAPVLVVNLAAFVTTIGGTIFFLFLSYSGREIAAAFSVARRGSTDVAECAHAELLFTSGARAAWASGCLGFLIQLIVVCLYINDPKSIGPSAASELFNILYALILAEFLLRPLAIQCRPRPPGDGEAGK
jgi:flagellar motor component MotA